MYSFNNTPKACIRTYNDAFKYAYAFILHNLHKFYCIHTYKLICTVDYIPSTYSFTHTYYRPFVYINIHSAYTNEHVCMFVSMNISMYVYTY